MYLIATILENREGEATVSGQLHAPQAKSHGYDTPYTITRSVVNSGVQYSIV